VNDTKQRFLEILLQTGALRFGEFVTKSGRKSPYFFNTGNFSSGRILDEVGEIYAEAYIENGLKERHIYGPAYKGIPLVVAMGAALWRNHEVDVLCSFNRKEAKDHGEGGTIIGAPLAGDILVVEDVLTGGTSVRETLTLMRSIKSAAVSPKPTTVLLGVDRQEKGSATRLARQELESEFGIKVVALLTLDEIISELHGKNVLGKTWINDEMFASIQSYRAVYG
jgi:orotate phosphoribosyltransferase